MNLDLIKFLLYFKCQSMSLIFLYRFSAVYVAILDIFWDCGLIYGYKVVKDTSDVSYLIIYPKKSTKLNRLSFIKFISLPSRRVFITYKTLLSLYIKERGMSIFFIRTNFGIFEGSVALNKRLGGELLFKLRF